MWVIISLSIAFANPERPFERSNDNLRQRNYAQLTGDGPVYGTKYGPIQAYVFGDGMIQQYSRPVDDERREIKRFSTTGQPLTRVLDGADGPINVKVYGPDNDVLFDVESWEDHTFGPITLRVPHKPTATLEQTHRWELEDGTLSVTEASGDPFEDRFSKNFSSTCRCVVLDRKVTWIDQRKALRITFERPIESRREYGTLWAIPTDKSLVVLQWVATSGTLLERPHATGRAMVALVNGAKRL